MTLSQVSAFLAAHEASSRAALLGQAIAARMAQAEGSKWKPYIKKLSGGE